MAARGNWCRAQAQTGSGLHQLNAALGELVGRGERSQRPGSPPRLPAYSPDFLSQLPSSAHSPLMLLFTWSGSPTVPSHTSACRGLWEQGDWCSYGHRGRALIRGRVSDDGDTRAVPTASTDSTHTGAESGAWKGLACPGKE